MSDDPKSLSKELAARDLADIKELSENRAFERYFIRRLRQRRDSVFNDFLNTNGLSAEEREVKRNLVLEYDNEILGMMRRDEASARRTIGSG